MLILTFAVACDYKCFKIKNGIIFLGWGTGLVLAHSSIGIANGMTGAILPIFILWPLFRHSMLGTGDIKLFSVVGMFYGSKFVLQVMIAAFFFGAVISVFHLARYGNLKIRLQYLANYISDYLKTKEVKEYYQLNRDGEAPAIHFTAAIFCAYVAALYRCIPI